MKKKLLQIAAAGSLLAASLVPVTVAHAASYYPGYTCYYRDISGSCLSYQSSNPYYFPATTTSPYGNRRSLTYPFQGMFNAYSTTPSTWDNRVNNRYNYYGIGRYEEDDDDNDYIDEDDDTYNHYYRNHDYKRDGNWEWYFDEDDDTYRPYRFQSDDDYDDGYYYRGSNNGYYEYENTRIYCTGRDCDTTHTRY